MNAFFKRILLLTAIFNFQKSINCEKSDFYHHFLTCKTLLGSYSQNIQSKQKTYVKAEESSRYILYLYRAYNFKDEKFEHAFNEYKNTIRQLREESSAFIKKFNDANIKAEEYATDFTKTPFAPRLSHGGELGEDIKSAYVLMQLSESINDHPKILTDAYTKLKKNYFNPFELRIVERLTFDRCFENMCNFLNEQYEIHQTYNVDALLVDIQKKHAGNLPALIEALNREHSELQDTLNRIDGINIIFEECENSDSKNKIFTQPYIPLINNVAYKIENDKKRILGLKDALEKIQKITLEKQKEDASHSELVLK